MKKAGYRIEFNVRPWDGPSGPKYAWPILFKTKEAAWNHINYVDDKLFCNSGSSIPYPKSKIPGKRIISACVQTVYMKA